MRPMTARPVPAVAIAAVLSAFSVFVPAPAAAQAPAGAAVFADHCATCHTAAGDPDGRIPPIAALRRLEPESILQTLANGAMREQGAEMTDPERRAVAAFLGQQAGAAGPQNLGLDGGLRLNGQGVCTSRPPFDPASGPAWNGWGVDVKNTRFQPAAQAGLTPDQVRHLTLKWAFGFPGATSARALPTVVGGRVFVGSQTGAVYALDARTGCTVWRFQASAEVRSAIVLGPRAGGGTNAYFGDGRAVVYALDAANGNLLWARKVEDHPSAHVTGSPTLYQGRLYVPVASGEEGTGGNAQYQCCTFRGSIVAIDVDGGVVAWKTYTIAETPLPIGTNAAGTTRFGPSGAGIWNSPTIDAKRGLLYAATGNMYTEPQHATSDAVIAFELNTGKIAWTSQVTPKDVFVVGCGARPGPNCPDSDDLGPDFDFGNAAMLATTPSGRDLIVIGQKSGVGWALDPDKKGAVVWQYRAGQGSALGGMEFGSAVDGQHAYFPVADGLHADAGRTARGGPRHRAARVARAAAAAGVRVSGHRGRPRVQRRAARRDQRDPRRRVRRLQRRRDSGLLDFRRIALVGIRHEQDVRHRERRRRPGRDNQTALARPWPAGWCS